MQIGYLKKGINPPSVTSLEFSPPYIMIALKTGIITGIIALAVSLPLLFYNLNINTQVILYLMIEMYIRTQLILSESLFH